MSVWSTVPQRRRNPRLVEGILGASIVLLTASCVCADDSAYRETVEHFERHVRPLFVGSCFECHQGAEPESGLRLTSREGILRGGLRGPGVVPGKPEESLIVRALRHGELLKMPPKEKLSTSEIAHVAKWIAAGAPWPGSETVKEEVPTRPAPSASALVSEEDRDFWSFRPLARPEAPAPRNENWCASPIDAFILHDLERAGFFPAPPATRRTLVRRLTFDLTGLPPTPVEVEEFVFDDSPDSYERLVDRLLSSPRYGEHWGRHWLDVARYADSNGLDENLAFANAFRYRDYVVEAINKDKPFSAFVREQIAGDLVDDSGDWGVPFEGMIATGFLSLGAKMLAEDDPVKMEMDIIDEQVDTLGRAFLGMTFGCARCHDHKFDPIPTADYYSLAGIFKSTKTMENFKVVARWQEKPVVTRDAAERLEIVKKKIAAKDAEIATLRELAREELLERERRHVGEYLIAAHERGLSKRALARAEVRGGQPDAETVSGAVLIEADEFDRGNVKRDRDLYGVGIGVTVNQGQQPNFVEFDIEVGSASAGLYQVEARLAAAASRPTAFSINGLVAKEDFGAAVTGSWFPDSQTWFVEGFFELRAGKNVLRLEHPQFFPHFDKLLLTPAPAEARPSRPLQFVHEVGARPEDSATRGVLVFETEKHLVRGNLVALTDGYGEGIGVIAGPGGHNRGELEVEIPNDGTYRVAIRYAAEHARPASLWIDDVLAVRTVTPNVTGSWFPDTQRWKLHAERLEIAKGRHVVRIERSGPIAHIDKIAFVDDSRLGMSLAKKLSDHETKSMFVDQWVAFLETIDAEGESPFARWRSASRGEDESKLFELARWYNEQVASLLERESDRSPSQAALATVLSNPSGPFRVASDQVELFEEKHRARLAELEKERATIDSASKKPDTTMAVSEGAITDVRVHVRGSHLTKGDTVPRRFPLVFFARAPESIAADRSGRLELANWIASDEHPLTARVIANRVWLWHFGEGLVRSPDNFGRLGLEPTHPGLLDWLARRLIESGWSLKALHREILMSSTYRMSTAWNEDAHAVDPDNKLWWRFPRRRMTAESLRDSVLAVAGTLELGMGGSILPTANRAYVTSTANVSPDAYKTQRRSMYMPVVRSALFEVFQAFDFAEPSVSSGQRQSTTVAPQALFMMNSRIVSEATRAMATRLLGNESFSDQERVVEAYASAYGRSPTSAETERALRFVNVYTESWKSRGAQPDEARLKSWQALCRVVLSANEFLYVE